jgi:hypothetical protein
MAGAFQDRRGIEPLESASSCNPPALSFDVLQGDDEQDRVKKLRKSAIEGSTRG